MSRSPHLRRVPLRTYRDATDLLESLVRTPPRTRDERERLGLSPIESLLDRIGNPHRKLAAIHITGSKGKGSTALYTEALLLAAGLRTGTFTSPHIEDWNERIRVAGSPIERSRFVEALERVRPAIAELHRADADSAPAFFDALVAAAFSIFADARVDIAVVEAGIGARLDPTRVCRAVATCVTGIELEHTERLGPIIADIAREKAAIVRPGIPLVTGSMPDAARGVLEREAARAGAPQRRLGREFTIRRCDRLWSTGPTQSDSAPTDRAALGSASTRPAPTEPASIGSVSTRPAPTEPASIGSVSTRPAPTEPASIGSVSTRPAPTEPASIGSVSTRPAQNDPGRQPGRSRTVTPPGSLGDSGAAEIVLPDRAIAVALRQPGRHMIENAALALALANEVGALRRLDDAGAGAALEATILPGRAEVLRETPLVIADGAHTRASIEALVEVLASRPSPKLVAVVSVTRGKDAAHLLRPLVRRAGAVIATAAEPSRSLPAEALAQVLRQSAPRVPIESIASPAGALDAATRLAGSDGTVCATGSMYVAGAARRILRAG